MTSAPLTGLRVLELGQLLGAPGCWLNHDIVSSMSRLVSANCGLAEIR